VIDALIDLPPHLRDRLASALESGLLSTPYSMGALRSALGAVGVGENLLEAVREMQRLGIEGAGAATMIRTISDVTRRATKPDIVWSGPEVPGLHARDTRRVFEELLSTAERSIWASTYAFFDGPRVFDTLSRRMDARPELHVTLLLNIERKKNDTSATEQVVRRFAERFWSAQWPGAAKPRVFYDPRSVDPDGPAGVLHAKAVVADEEAVFVTSANLTEAALDRNIELGLLVRDPALAASLARHFQVLIDRELLRPLPIA
jgi:phosphatidylserine/phosphatidylglycerophosphate/cardiolipin synthase-like enzyme